MVTQLHLEVTAHIPGTCILLKLAISASMNDTGANAKLFWDASAESLGIGTDAPATALHVRGTASTVGATRSVVTGLQMILRWE